MKMNDNFFSIKVTEKEYKCGKTLYIIEFVYTDGSGFKRGITKTVDKDRELLTTINSMVRTFKRNAVFHKINVTKHSYFRK